MLKSDKIIIAVIVVYVLFVILCMCLNCVNSNLHTLPHISRKGPVINPSVDNNSLKKNLSLLSANNQENFRMPYDKDYVDPFMFYAEVSMEFDPEDLIGGKIPSFAPIASIEKEILAEEEKEKKETEEEDEDEDAEVEGVKGKGTKGKGTKGQGDKGKGINSKGTKGKGKNEKEIQGYTDGTPEFYRKCRPVAKVGEDGFTHKYNFAKNSALLGTIYENLFHQKCTDYFAKQNQDGINNLLKLNLPSYQITQLQDQVQKLGYSITDEDISDLENIINGNPPNLEEELKNSLEKKGKEAEDLDNMYLTKESKEGQNIVDTIQSLSNNNEDSSEEEEKLVMCLKRYKGDEDRCFSPRKRNKDTFCRVPECYSPLLVIGSCTLNSLDTEPYFFETNAHFIIKKHPENSKRRIIYMNQRGDSRRCESDPKYFRAYLDVRRKERLIELAENKIQFMKTQEIVLTDVQKKEYEDLGKKIEKLEGSHGSFAPAPGDSNIDYHAQAQSKNKDLKESKETYSKFKQKIRDKMLEEEKAKKAKLEKELEELKKNESGFDDSKKRVSSRICLKYAMDGNSVVAKLLYEDDRRNLVKGYRSDWFVVKHLDKTGKETGFYKIKGEIGGQKFNLSKKPKPKEIGFVGFGMFVFEPAPKMEDQLWMIKEVGDLNSNVVLGEVKEETEIREIGAEADEKQTNKVVEWT